MNDDLLVPWGLSDQDELVPVHTATKGLRYRCPSCKKVLVLAQGPILRHHFRHVADSECSWESREHAIAKGLVLRALQSLMDGGPHPVLRQRCTNCRDPQPCAFDFARIVSACAERRLTTGHIGDVVAYDKHGVAIVVEILKTHAVSDRKGEALEVAKISWIEISADRILNDPMDWMCIAAWIAPGTNQICSRCRGILARQKTVKERSLAFDSQMRLLHQHGSSSPPQKGAIEAIPEDGFWVRYMANMFPVGWIEEPWVQYWETDFHDRSRQQHFETLGYTRCDRDGAGQAVLLHPPCAPRDQPRG